jgi:hypothetical protein
LSESEEKPYGISFLKPVKSSSMSDTEAVINKAKLELEAKILSQVDKKRKY